VIYDEARKRAVIICRHFDSPPMIDHRRAMPTSMRASVLRVCSVAALACSLGGSLEAQLGDAETPRDVDRRCTLTVELDPATGAITGEAAFALPDLERFLTSTGTVPVALDPRLTIEGAAAEDAVLAVERAGVDESSGLARWSIAAPAIPARSIVLRWSGVVRDDVRAGEAPGRIHNTSVRAHVGEDGIYLAPDSAWHPALDAERAGGWTGPDPPLCTWTLDVTSPLPLVASGNRERSGEDLATVARWITPFPQASVAVAGGPLVDFERDHGNVRIHALLRPSSAEHAPRLLDAVAGYLDLYQPLLGDYPFREFTVVENFFSSGFAFPGFTLLSSEVIAMGERGLRPGYLDHELLHNWWGNGVLASHRSGHWAEALATYGANYMRPVLEGRREHGRAQRRSVAEALSANAVLAAEAVGDYGLDGAVGTFIGYQKGAMVFDQLATRLGQDRLWAGLRRFHRDRLGKSSTWTDLRAAFEAESGVDLATFFSFWVDGPGLPAPRFDQATWDAEARQVRLDIAYEDPVTIDIPLRLRFADDDGAEPMTRPTERVTLHPGDTSLVLASERRPSAIEIDPEFETIRRVAPELLMPTLSGLAPPLDLVLISGEEDLAGYQAAATAIERRYGKNGQIERRRRFEPRLLEHGHVLLLGRAALDDRVEQLFAPEQVEIWERGFALEAVRYVSGGDALLACVRNPQRGGAFVCVYWGNGDEALARADLLPYYGGNSLLVFDRGQPFVRRDFEAIERIEVR
jgi:hypothetical protein